MSAAAELRRLTRERSEALEQVALQAEALGVAKDALQQARTLIAVLADSNAKAPGRRGAARDWLRQYDARSVEWDPKRLAEARSVRADFDGTPLVEEGAGSCRYCDRPAVPGWEGCCVRHFQGPSTVGPRIESCSHCNGNGYEDGITSNNRRCAACNGSGLKPHTSQPG